MVGYIIGYQSISDLQLLAGDYDGNGIINVTDVVSVLYQIIRIDITNLNKIQQNKRENQNLF